MPFLPPPSIKNMMYDQADWKKRNLSIDKATIRHCQFHALPESYQQRLLDDAEDWKAMTEVVWLDRLLCGEEYDKQIIASKERIAKKADKAASSPSRADDTSNIKRHKKNLKPKSAKEKTARGKARYCSMCKKARMPEGKWKGDYEQKFSGNAKSNSDAKAQYKREIRKLQKATKSATSKSKKFAKAAKSAKSSKELRKFQKSLSKGKKKRNKSSSDESDESGQISESSSSSDSSDSSSASSY